MLLKASYWLEIHYKGIALALGIALLAEAAGKIVPIVGAPVFGIILGILAGNLFQKPLGTKDGLLFTSKKILQFAIVALGAGLSLKKVFETGLSSLYVMLFTITVAFIAAYLFGRLLKISFKLTSLIGMGTAICGGSAIVAISPIIEAEDREIAYSISTVFMFNVIAVLIFPPLGHMLGFSANAFGLWAGTAINDTSSVVAAAYSYSSAAGAYAVIVKLARTTMIIPISLIFTAAVTFAKKWRTGSSSGAVYSFRKIFPWFIVWFLAASLLNTLGFINAQAAGYITAAGKFMIVTALSAIGLNSNFRQMLKAGFKPMLLGLIVWICVAVTSIIVQYMTGQV